MEKHYLYDSDNALDIAVTDFTIHDKLSWNQLLELENIFFQHNKLLSYTLFRETLETLNIVMSNAQYQKLFLKINLNYGDDVHWNHLMSYFIFYFKQENPQGQIESLKLPISMDPVIKKGCHKTSIIGISIMESIIDDDEDTFGAYLTVCKEGSINFWSPDFEIVKKGNSHTQYLQYTSTWILDIVALSDISVICVSSTERELRFYDVMATNFHLRLVLRSVPCAICKMTYYHMMSHDSKLLMGDLNGNVHIIEFSPEFRGPFQSKAGSLLMEFTWIELLKGKFPAITAKTHPNVFSQFITNILYSLKLDTIFVSAEGSGRSGGLIGIDNRGIRTHYFIPMGVSSFTLDEHTRILATGGPDSVLRLWDPLIISHASVVLPGHHAGIIYIFIQHEESKCYSIDKDKIIKVWDLFNYTLLQSYANLIILIPNESALVYMYNKVGHELLIGGRKLTSIKCCLKVQLALTDGYTHTAAISIVLYNHLFENIVTCGTDSNIIVWDIWTGKRQIMIKGCHTEDSLGETIYLEITAATFDPARQFLLTGARDGSLKIWNYNNAVCVRNMNIQKGCEVTGLIWVVDRIFAVGWNRRICEFAATIDGQYSDPKKWYGVHLADITAVTFKAGQTLVTGSSSGELIYWKIETGQPYIQFNVSNPKECVPIVVNPKLIVDTEKEAEEDEEEKEEDDNAKRRQIGLNILKLGSRSVSKMLSSRFNPKSQESEDDLPEKVKQVIVKKNVLRRLDSRGVIMPLPVVRPPSDEVLKLKTGILELLFLKTRPISREYGSIVVALDNGYIQVYSHHQVAGFMDEFYIIHKSGDCCLSMATDKTNQYLFTGTAFGYLKVWLLQNYCVPKSEHTHICMPLLRLQFIFMTHDRILGRAKRIARQKEPLLLNSYKAHLRGITSIVYIEHSKILITGSNDFTVRMWTLGGRYLGTLGGSIPTRPLSRTNAIDEYNEKFRIPPDINKVSSSTTMKVLSGKAKNHLRQYIREMLPEGEIIKKQGSGLVNESLTNLAFPKRGRSRICIASSLRTPLLGNHFKIFEHNSTKSKPKLVKNLPHIPVYTHLRIHDAKIIERPHTPEHLRSDNKIKSIRHSGSKSFFN